MDLWLRILTLAVLSYAFGNWSMARMIAWNYRRVDIADFGSGNPGTMNTVRTFGFKKGFAVLLLDVLKGVVPALLGYCLLESYLGGAGFRFSLLGVYIGGLSVIIGHMFPVVFKFKGGKGVACGIGVFLVANPLAMLIVFIGGFLIFFVFEYGFVASLFCILAITVIEYIRIFGDVRFFADTPVTGYKVTVAVLIAVIFMLIYAAHWKNFYRLFTGKESKLSMRAAIKKNREKKNETAPEQVL